jgi:O-antigen biosynthesis protein
MPRLIDWTGERLVPWAPDIPVVYEHYHRYLWAAELLRGRRVLDLGSGEGFGSAILAARAAHVLGVDIDATTVEHSRLNYARAGLEFRVGSALELDALERGAFGAVVAFEMIEHVDDHERVLAGIDHVLAEDGILVMSTPDTRLYTDARAHENPFHLRELDEAGFRALLGSRFSHVALWGQRAIAGSRIASVEAGAATGARTAFIERTADAWSAAGEPAPLYFVAVASRTPIALPPAESTLVDAGLEIVAGSERRATAAQRELDAARERIVTLHDELMTTAANSADGWARYHALRDRRAVRWALGAASLLHRFDPRRR